jgi:hypothetical protein
MNIIAETASKHMRGLDFLKNHSLRNHHAGASMVLVRIYDLVAFVARAGEISYWIVLKKIKIYVCRPNIVVAE